MFTLRVDAKACWHLLSPSVNVIHDLMGAQQSTAGVTVWRTVTLTVDYCAVFFPRFESSYNTEGTFGMVVSAILFILL